MSDPLADLLWNVNQMPTVPGDYTEVVGEYGRGPFISLPSVREAIARASGVRVSEDAAPEDGLRERAQSPDFISFLRSVVACGETLTSGDVDAIEAALRSAPAAPQPICGDDSWDSRYECVRAAGHPTSEYRVKWRGRPATAHPSPADAPSVATQSLREAAQAVVDVAEVYREHRFALPSAVWAKVDALRSALAPKEANHE